MGVWCIKGDMKTICWCPDEGIIIIITDIVLLLAAPLICCCSSLLKGFSVFNYIKCSNAKETQTWQWASFGSALFTAAPQHITLLKKKKQICESSLVITRKKEFLSIWLQLFRDETTEAQLWSAWALRRDDHWFI